MQAALQLEKNVNQSLLDLHKVADKYNDYQVLVLSRFLMIYIYLYIFLKKNSQDKCQI